MQFSLGAGANATVLSGRAKATPQRRAIIRIYFIVVVFVAAVVVVLLLLLLAIVDVLGFSL